MTAITDQLQAMADHLMSTLGVPAVYRAGGTGDPVDVTVRCKPRRRLMSQGKTFLVMEISVRSTEVADPAFNDVFEICGVAWELRALPMESYESSDHAGGTLWQLTLTRGAASTLRGGAA